MRAVLFIFLLGPLAALGAPDDGGFVWIDANTKMKTNSPNSAASGGSAPEKAPEPQKKPKSKKKADK